MTTVAEIKLDRVIAPAFYGLHRDIRYEGHTHYVLKGGRGSTKSSFTSIEIILGIMQHPDAHAVILRKVGNTLHDSVFTQILWAVSALGVQEYFRPNQSLSLIHI